MRRRMWGDRSGQTMIVGTLTLVLFFFILGLAVDLGWGYFRRHQAQAAADSAALAAASYAQSKGYTCGTNGVVCGVPYTCVGATPAADELQAGCLYAASNGFTSGVTMTSNTSGSPVAGNSPAYWVQASITQSVPAMFLGIKGISSMGVNVQAVAGINVTPPNSCIYVLDPNGPHAMDMTGTANVTSTCAVSVDSTNPNALRMVGSGSLTAGAILVSGGTSLGSNVTVSPTPLINQPTFSNPLSTVSFPTYGACDHVNWSTNSDASLSPGVYCGGITIGGSAAVTFASGNYILNGGGLTWSGSGNLTGSGVTFLNTGSSSYSAGPVKMTGSGTLNFTSPISGTYQGILFFQDPGHSYGTGNQISGSNSSTVSGTLYFPTTSLTYTGTTTGQYTSLIVYDLLMVGTTNLLTDTTGHYSYIARRSATLLE